MKHERISTDPKVMVGKPCIKGTRIPVDHVLRKLGPRLNVDNVLEAYPHLTIEDVEAAVAYAADHLAGEEIIFAEGVRL